MNRVDIGLIRGVDRVRDILVDNTERFAAGLPANNALLWGARGMGKSSLVKAVHAYVNASHRGEEPLKLVEIHREDIDTLPKLMNILKDRALPLHPVLRRPVLRPRRHVIQIAQGGAGGRRRGPPGKRHLLCDLQPPASPAARHDRE